MESAAEIVHRLACYLRANPHAGDTTDGIARCWLGLSSDSTEVLVKAVDFLVAQGLLCAVRAADGRVHYRRVSASAAMDARLDQLIAGTVVSRL
jgi:hypothetical protein